MTARVAAKESGCVQINTCPLRGRGKELKAKAKPKRYSMAAIYLYSRMPISKPKRQVNGISV